MIPGKDPCQVAKPAARNWLDSGAVGQGGSSGTVLAVEFREGSEAEAECATGLKRNRAECTDLCSSRVD